MKKTNYGFWFVVMGSLCFFFGIFNQVQGLTLSLIGLIITVYVDLDEKIYRLQIFKEEATKE